MVSIRLSVDEAWEFIASSHTGIFTTLRSDGFPVALPVWFVVVERTICLSAPSRTKKVARVQRDPRASFLVESGKAWARLKAVHLTGEVDIVSAADRQQQIAAMLDDKYAAWRTPVELMPDRTIHHYAGRTFLQFHPHERMLTWDNGRIELERQ